MLHVGRSRFYRVRNNRVHLFLFIRRPTTGQQPETTWPWSAAPNTHLWHIPNCSAFPSEGKVGTCVGWKIKTTVSSLINPYMKSQRRHVAQPPTSSTLTMPTLERAATLPDKGSSGPFSSELYSSPEQKEPIWKESRGPLLFHFIVLQGVSAELSHAALSCSPICFFFPPQIVRAIPTAKCTGTQTSAFETTQQTCGVSEESEVFPWVLLVTRHFSTCTAASRPTVLLPGTSLSHWSGTQRRTVAALSSARSSYSICCGFPLRPPRIRSHSPLSAVACSKVSAAEEPPACREGGGEWSLGPGGGGGWRGEGQTPFKFTNTGVGMTGSCPLGVFQWSTAGEKSLRCRGHCFRQKD